MNRVTLGALALVLASSSSCKDPPADKAAGSADDRNGSARLSDASPESICQKLDALLSDDEKEKKKREKDPSAAKSELDGCVRDLAEIRDVSQKGYACIAACPRYKSADAALGCFLECQDNDEKLKERTKKKAESETIDRSKKMLEWTKRKDKTFDSSVKDLDKDLKYSIVLVDGFVEKAVADSLKTYDLEDSEAFSSAHLSVMSYFAEDGDKAAEEASSLLKKKVIKKEKASGGYVLDLQGEDGDLDVEVLVKAGDTYLKCSAGIYGAKGFEKDLLPWMEKLCTSLKAK